MFTRKQRRWGKSSLVKLQIKTTFSFAKLARFIDNESASGFHGQVNRILGSHIAESSKRFIMQGQVKPRLEKSTIQIRNKRGVQTNTPLFETGTLANSLKPVEEGIKGAYYGEYHLKGYKTKKGSMIPNKVVPKRNFIAFEKEKIQKPLNTLMKKIHKALKK